MTDLDIINEIERKIGIKLKSSRNASISSTNHYQLDESNHVTALCIKGARLRRMPRIMFDLLFLRRVSFWDNQIVEIPSEIKQLVKLEELCLSENLLTTLPEEMYALSSLRKLYLDCNKFSDIPISISRLKEMRYLNLRKNVLSQFPLGVTEMINLEVLNLSRNNLKVLPQEICQLTNLQVLYLSRNNLTNLPSELMTLTSLRGETKTGVPRLLLLHNPLENPPIDIAIKGFDAICHWLEVAKKKGFRVNNEAKLILVGQGDVGKTCLAKRLIYDTFQAENSTKGIDIIQWDIQSPTPEAEPVRLNVWDFGGQEIYHATHQFFLTKRSVYVLVWNARKSKDYEHLYYWLHTIEAFGEDSPIIVVLSKCHERDDDLNMKDLRERFPQIVELYKVDSADGCGIANLREVVRDIAWNLPHMRTPWIEPWLLTRRQLEADGRDWINEKTFYEVCWEHGLDGKQANILDEYLHDLGVIIHFRDRLELRNMVVLKPEWATHAVYKVLDTQSVRDRDGVLLHRELDNIWDPQIYPPDIYPQLLHLMNRFELAYPLPDGQSHLVAELLPSTEPDFAWDHTDNLRFYYRYDFLPAGVITRFIVLTHHILETAELNGFQKPLGSRPHDLCWREGAVLNREGTRAYIKVDKVERTIEIRIKGSQPRELLAIIRHHFDHINRTIKKVKITQEIPCNCTPDCKNVFNYDQLRHGERLGEKDVKCLVSWKTISLESLLNGYESKHDRQKSPQELAVEKITRLKKAHVIAVDEAEKFRIEHQIVELEAEIVRLETWSR